MPCYECHQHSSSVPGLETQQPKSSMVSILDLTALAQVLLIHHGLMVVVHLILVKGSYVLESKISF